MHHALQLRCLQTDLSLLRDKDRIQRVYGRNGISGRLDRMRDPFLPVLQKEQMGRKGKRRLKNQYKRRKRPLCQDPDENHKGLT